MAIESVVGHVKTQSSRWKALEDKSGADGSRHRITINQCARCGIKAAAHQSLLHDCYRAICCAAARCVIIFWESTKQEKRGAGWSLHKKSGAPSSPYNICSAAVADRWKAEEGSTFSARAAFRPRQESESKLIGRERASVLLAAFKSVDDADRPPAR